MMAVCVVYAEQCCHAAVMAYEQLYERHPDLLEEWRFHGQPKVVLKTEDEESLLVSTSLLIYSASTAVTLDSSHMTASSSASWSRFSPPPNFVNGLVLTMWFMVCCWPRSQEVIG